MQFLPVTVEGQDLRLAYMDVKPTANAQGHTFIGRGKVPADVAATLGQYPELGKKTAASPRAHLMGISGVGHIPHLEAPDKFHSLLCAFLNPSP